MRLALGTAQFGLRYGIANRSGQVAEDQIGPILELAQSIGIDTLDTAKAYGSAEIRLGQIGVGGWKVVSKLSPLPDQVEDAGQWVRDEIQGSLARLGVSVLDGLLLHRPADLLGDRAASYREALESAKIDGRVKAVGYSIYSPIELDALCAFMWPDIVQAPFNVVDRRLWRSGWMDRLANRGVRIHTRSAFLQGLLLMSEEARPGWFNRWSGLLSGWTEACRESDNRIALALGFVLSFPQIERVVVGVDSIPQLRQIFDALTNAQSAPVPDVESQDLELIEPSRWRLE